MNGLNVGPKRGRTYFYGERGERGTTAESAESAETA